MRHVLLLIAFIATSIYGADEIVFSKERSVNGDWVKKEVIKILSDNDFESKLIDKNAQIMPDDETEMIGQTLVIMSLLYDASISCKISGREYPGRITAGSSTKELKNCELEIIIYDGTKRWLFYYELDVNAHSVKR